MSIQTDPECLNLNIFKISFVIYLYCLFVLFICFVYLFCLSRDYFINMKIITCLHHFIFYHFKKY